MNIYVVPQDQLKLYQSVVPADVAALIGGGHTLVIGAYDEEKNRICGALCAFIDGEECEVEFFYVDVKERRRGIGTAMLELLRDLARGMLITEIHASYVRLDGMKDEPDMFFDALSCKIEETSTLYAVNLRDVGAGFSMSKRRAAEGSVFPLSGITGRMWNTLSESIAKEQELHIEDEVFGRAVFINPGSMGNYDSTVSLVHFNKEEEADACILVKRIHDHLELKYLFVQGNDLAGSALIGEMIQMAWDRAVNEYGEKVKLYINPVIPSAEKMLKKLSGNALSVDSEQIVRNLW